MTQTRDIPSAAAKPAMFQVLLGWLLCLLLAFVFLFAVGVKLLSKPVMVEEFNRIGLGQWFRYVTGALEVFGAIDSPNFTAGPVHRSASDCLASSLTMLFHCSLRRRLTKHSAVKSPREECNGLAIGILVQGQQSRSDIQSKRLLLLFRFRYSTVAGDRLFLRSSGEETEHIERLLNRSADFPSPKICALFQGGRELWGIGICLTPFG